MNPTAVDRILADFRAWLEQQPDEPALAPPAEPVDLATLVRHFTALRQEVNLQTRASRGQMEQNAQALEELRRALDELHAEADVEEVADGDEELRPLLKALIDARDALALAERQVGKTRASLAAVPALGAPPPLPHPPTFPPWLRLLGLKGPAAAWIAAVEAWARAEVAAHAGVAPDLLVTWRDTLESLAAGYAMSLQRLDRALEQRGLERIACVGLPFDPEIMEVVDVVKEEGRSATEVIEEVRPGYRRAGRLFRPAQVRVARP